MLTARVLLGDCKEHLKTLESDSFDALVTDPPAGIGFMGKAWDSYESLHHFREDMTEVFKEVSRVLKPGAHGLVWALPKTCMYTSLALIEARLELRDMVLHLFGSGMPKAMPNPAGSWSGWNTALKPAHEIWWLVRKPLSEPTIAAQLAATGTGMINIDGCRVAGLNPSLNRRETARRTGTVPLPGLKSHEAVAQGRISRRGTAEAYLTDKPGEHIGRWPSNLLLSHECTAECVDCAVTLLDSQALGASQYFYTVKLGRAERRLLDGTENKHPTAKSVKLMRYLVRLVTPPGGTVLDPFAGSGTTGVAAIREGFSFQGIELDPEHHRVATLRLEQALTERGNADLLWGDEG